MDLARYYRFSRWHCHRSGLDGRLVCLPIAQSTFNVVVEFRNGAAGVVVVLKLDKVTEVLDAPKLVVEVVEVVEFELELGLPSMITACRVAGSSSPACQLEIANHSGPSCIDRNVKAFWVQERTGRP